MMLHPGPALQAAILWHAPGWRGALAHLGGGSGGDGGGRLEGTPTVKLEDARSSGGGVNVLGSHT